MYKVVYTKQASKKFYKLPRNIQRVIKDKLEQLATNPHYQHPNVTKLQKRAGYRLRIGNWRVIYEIKDDRLIILVLKIGSRGDVYR
ncbi:MAG: type II toxin-antitoxin system RelE/ParE family toxin [Anaerolineales bacterium]|nr:type II toxin-antitoxin system RelE/ParE family toxin [Chloroflexota bacterium]MBL6980136.1 type II toxin-antitoxin system RelE/ParE family toxin [Anaerolineales bacterium]